jgi:hypothetical protein
MPGMSDSYGVQVPQRRRWYQLLAEGNGVAVRRGRKEAGWQTPAPRNTNRIRGEAIWVSQQKMVKPASHQEVAR